MGYKLYQYTRKIEKIEGGYFANKASKLEGFLEKECPSLYTESGENTETWEIAVEDIIAMIKKLETFSPDDTMLTALNVDLGNITVGDFINVFKQFLKAASKKENFSDNDYIYLTWI